MLVLNAVEILALPGLFPAKGTIQDNVAIKGIREKTELTEADLLSIEFAVEAVAGGGQRLKYNRTKALGLTRSIALSANEIDLLKAQVAEMDQKKQITQSVLDIALKIRDTTRDEVMKKEVC